jgi:tetratricopeptide (TPR) repeat protein
MRWLWLALGVLAGCQEPVQGHLRAAKDAVFEHKPEVALREYRQALDLLERDESPKAKVLTARALRGAADVYYLELRDFPRAVEVYRELIAACPEAKETLEARIHLAEILAAQFRDLRGAISALTSAIERNSPQSAELSYRVAKLYFELGDYQQAGLEAKKLEERYETSGYVDDALLLQAQALGMEDRRAEQVRVLQDLVARFADSELVPHALYELGSVRAEQGEHDQAIALWVAALERHPDPPLVQRSITRLRRRIAHTTPRGVGDEGSAFDRTLALPPPAVRKPARTSLEAAGASAAEAAAERGGD